MSASVPPPPQTPRRAMYGKCDVCGEQIVLVNLGDGRGAAHHLRRCREFESWSEYPVRPEFPANRVEGLGRVDEDQIECWALGLAIAAIALSLIALVISAHK